MTNYDYLIIGGGMTGAAAADGIREVDANGSIGMFSAEGDAPYNRPPLSKGLWKGDPLDSVWRKMKDERPKLNLGRIIKEIVPDKRRVIDSAGAVFSYAKLLLATGGTPRRLPFNDDQVIYFRTLSDYQRLRALTETGRRFAIIGGGFIGSEIAAALAANGKNVVLIFPGQEIGERLFPRELSEYVSSVYRQKGVELVGGEKVVSSEARGNQRVLTTASGREIIVDSVIAGIGIEPNIELAQAAGLSTSNGIVVDEFLGTSVPGIYAAGDVAEFYNATLAKRMRVEHEDNANSMGRLAGRNMAGMIEPYDHLPSFYSDMFELGYEAVGEVDSRLDTFADWKRPNEEGVVYYLKDGRVRGVLLWNVWNQVPAAHALIAEPGPFTGDNLKGRFRPNHDGSRKDTWRSAKATWLFSSNTTNIMNTDTNLNQLEKIKKVTTVVADTADFESIRVFRPQDATTNPSLVYAATQKKNYSHLLDEVLAKRRDSGLSGAAQMEDIIDHLLVRFGIAMLEIVPGRVSTETDVRYSFDVEASIKKARRLIALYKEQGIERERVLIKIASTWEGIMAAEQLQKEGIKCNVTLLFSLPQAVRAAEAKVQLISPFVGRIYDWFKAANNRDYSGAEDPGVQSVREIYTYYKHFGYETEVMGASFRNVGQIIELVGCDLLTISPELMKELSEAYAPVEQKLSPERAKSVNVRRLDLDEKKFRYLLNEDAMATEKTAEGIRKFAADIAKLEKLVADRVYQAR